MAVDKAAMEEERINRVLTQYRESPNLLGLIRAVLSELADVAERGDAIQSAFNIDTSVGDQLTMIGKWLGWPRTHCQGSRAKVFGFACEDDDCSVGYPVLGFCEGARFACDGAQFEEYTFEDDELYRRYLKARAVAINSAQTNDYTRESLVAAATAMFGAECVIVKEGRAEIILCLTRFFTSDELQILHLAEHVLPIAPGVKLTWAHCDGAIFGFGAGWGEMCTSSFYKIITDPLERKPKSGIFGFGPDWSGFCTGRFYSGDPADLEFL
ncbi:DUF2612 domain-containing protein [Shinella sp. DD12]|uniref:DUF2612 domain-containing protein n=1 Tax=Shinella sp. DD12 TaxID=1410620 RepID=UPI000437985C|nr:DUF2612 domain-containing protein [Shinella sp. DD12]EYR81374.1 hypothetical protein DUF2612 [Shinella sp. DD12]